ncbi:MAG: FKBP-type peptidyl-prolyl cis-trans isomerase, partial [Myxococcales bacterium]
MRPFSILLLPALLLAMACDPGKSEAPLSLESDDAKVNYSIGYQIGGDFLRQDVPPAPDALVAGIRDALAGAEAKLSEEERQETLVALQARMQAAQQALQQAAGETNLAAAMAFLAENGAKEGVTTLPSGLQYKVLTEGSGPKPAAADTVTVHYRGKLIDGNEFDSSYSRNAPATCPLNRVIKAWTEGLQLMGEGAKWELYVPPDLGYGAQGAGDRIPPQSALVFEVEL